MPPTTEWAGSFAASVRNEFNATASVRGGQEQAMLERAVPPADITEPRREPAPRLTYRFGPFMLDASRRFLLSGSVAKPLPEFFTKVWPEGLLRQILGERAGENAYVVTVAGIGYRFAVPIESKLGLLMKGSCEGADSH